mgnify:CR=1 FL=1
MEVIAIVVCVLAATALGICAWKLPNIRTWLVAGAGTLLGFAGLLIAMLSSRGDIDRAKRVTKAKRDQRAAAKTHKQSLKDEAAEIEGVKDEAFEAAAAADKPPDLQDLADKFNSR